MIANQESATMVHRNSFPLRPDEVLEHYGPRFGEYPASLLTRRTYNLRTDAVVDRRETAPNAIWLDARTNPDAWNTAGE